MAHFRAASTPIAGAIAPEFPATHSSHPRAPIAATIVMRRIPPREHAVRRERLKLPRGNADPRFIRIPSRTVEETPMDLTKLWLTGVAIFIIFMSGSGVATQPPEPASAAQPQVAPPPR